MTAAKIRMKRNNRFIFEYVLIYIIYFASMKSLSKYFFLGAIATILLSALSVFLIHQGFAQKLFVISFFLLILGTVFYIIEIRNEK